MFSVSLAVFGAFALLTSASPIAYANSTNACAQIGAIYAAKKTTPTTVVTVPGQLAYDCLNSVPIRQKDASALINSILPYVEWQTTVDWLKDPPKGYQEPAVDIRAELNKVVQKVENNSYGSEYAFQADIFRTFNLVHDGHFRFFGDLLTETLTFQRQIPVVSVSLDGEELPKVYARSDIDAYNGETEPSAFKTINGIDAETFLNDWAQLGALQDPDSLWNTVFFSKPFAGTTPTWEGYFAGSGRFGYIWPGASTEVVYENGTTITYPTLSTVTGNFTGITSGEDVYQRFCVPSNEISTPAATPAPVTQVNGYPAPVIVSSDGVVSGYYLADQPDVAVLVMLSFEPESIIEFQYVVQTFFAQSKKDGKTKLVVDVSANGGGYILQGYDTFRQLFPQIVQDGNDRFRYIPATKAIVDQYNKVLANETAATIANADDTLISIYETPFNYKYDLNTKNQHFKSVKEKFGPYTYDFGSGPDEATGYFRWDLNDPLTTINSTYGLGTDITGYGSRRNFTQPFATQDVILLYDGYCASTCTLFSDFMKNQAGVKSVVFGGRPSRNPQQAIGGTKGSNNIGFDDAYYYSQLAFEIASPAEQNTTLAVLQQYTLLPTERSSGTSLNFRDGIHTRDLDTGIPAQFVYEPADCRLFYTPDMIQDVSAIWKATAQVAWGNKECIQGGLPQTHKRGLEKRKSAVLDRRIEVPSFPALSPHPFGKSVRGEKVPI